MKWSKTVVLLALVSLCADLASEMLYPILPLYLKSIGFSMALIGLLEGLAEATAGLSKGYFGQRSDQLGTRLPFVRGGYLASALAKPLMGLWAWPWWVFFARTLDRLGKGLRTGARDAMLSAEATPATKGRIFGFHRGMDTLGAVLGPLFALFYLYHRPGDYRTLFFIALGPGLLSVALAYAIREQQEQPAKQAKQAPFWGFLGYWRRATPTYRRVVTGLLFFQLFNSSDTFLLLKMQHGGLDDAHLVGAYVFYNVIFAAAAYPLGGLADRWGMKRVFVLGLFLFAATYAGFVWATGLWAFVGLLALYGFYAAATQGVAKAWISNTCDPSETGTAIGTYAAFQSLAALLASLLAGLAWQYGGPTAPFLLAAIGALGVAAYVLKGEQ